MIMKSDANGFACKLQIGMIVDEKMLAWLQLKPNVISNTQFWSHANKLTASVLTTASLD